MSIIEIIKRKPTKFELLRSKLFYDLKFGVFISTALVVIVLIFVILLIFAFYFIKNFILHLKG